MEPKLVIMAAGLGSRFGGTKQLTTITDEGDLLMDFSIYDAIEAGFKNVVLIIKKDMESIIKKRIDTIYSKKINVTYVIQDINDVPEWYELPEKRVKPWGTAHAVLSCANVIDAPFAVINADDYYGKKAFRKIYKFLTTNKKEDRAAMIGYKIKNTVPENGSVTRGICTVQNEYLTNIIETKGIRKMGEIIEESDGVQICEDAIVSMNFWGFNKDFIEQLKPKFDTFLCSLKDEEELTKEFLLPIEIGKMITSGEIRVKNIETDDLWCGITNKSDLDFIRKFFKKIKEREVYPKFLWD